MIENKCNSVTEIIISKAAEDEGLCVCLSHAQMKRQLRNLVPEVLERFLKDLKAIFSKIDLHS